MSQRNHLDRRRGVLSPAKQALLEKSLKGRILSADKPMSIPRREQGISVPLSFAQQRLWFLDQLEPGSSVYNIPAAFHLLGPLDVKDLERSLHEITRRHETLRTTFSVVDHYPVQVIAPSRTLRLNQTDLTGLPEAEKEAAAMRSAGEEARRPFDLVRGPLFRAALWKLGHAEHILLLTMHHIVSDGWSRGVLYEELSQIYTAFRTGKPHGLQELPIQYGDFALWQRRRLQGEVLEKQRSYWKAQLEGVPAALELPTDRPRPPVQTYVGERQSVVLSKELSDGLKAMSLKEEVSLFMTLLAAFQVLLYRYTGQEDIVVGCPIANRTMPEIEGLIGFFVNTLVLRGDLSRDPSFRGFLRRVKEAALAAYDHQDLPFEKLVEEIQPERDLSRMPLVQVFFQLRNFLKKRVGLPGLRMEHLELDDRIARFDLGLDITDEPEGLLCVFTYNTDLFDAATITRMTRHFKTLLEGAVETPERPISQLPLLTEAECHQILVGWNDTQAEYPEDTCIHEMFEAQVERTPDAAAVVFEKQRLTYDELNVRANRLARYLRKEGVGPEVLVGILMQRSIEMVIAILGVLKAGGAYVPLDADYPEERLAHLLESTRVGLLLTKNLQMKNLPEYSGQVIYLDQDYSLFKSEKKTNPTLNTRAENLAYVMYTSGSTGTPKGLMISHRGIVNYFSFYVKAYDLAASDVVLQLASYSFDPSVREIIGPLTIGAEVVIVNNSDSGDPVKLISKMKDHRVTCLLCVVPTMLNALSEAASSKDLTSHSLRIILVGGEPLYSSVYKKSVGVFGRRVLIVNQYGPTECSMVSTYYPIPYLQSDGNIVLIGKPIPNFRVYILDGNLNPVPVGSPGELHITGPGMARGYFNRPDLTAERFIPDPLGQEPGARMYKTGDLCRFVTDGNIEFIGRTDHQVKIRGFRIEPGEIESKLVQHPSITGAVVSARDFGPGERYLAAYVTTVRNNVPNVSEIRRFLKEKLPEYMIPSAFMWMNDFPRTSSGKIDRTALPDPPNTRPQVEADFEGPNTGTEETLAHIFAQVLGIDQVGRHDNFFDLGGHSLLAMRVVSRVNVALDVQIPVRTFYESPTVAGLALAVLHSQIKKKDKGSVNGFLDELEQLSEEEVEVLLDGHSS